ncbi:MAG: nuclear transport factor 2 family protein [Gemmatimonadaceae bacterium]|nr:nuclear transport factor 2 family protein [Gemmatimonadaceae bacterium]
MDSVAVSTGRTRFRQALVLLSVLGPAAARVATALTLLAAAACARVEVTRAPALSWAADEAAIRAATTASADAWNRGDLKGHLAIYVDSVTFMTKAGPRPGVAAIEQSFTTTYFRDGLPKQQLRFEQTTIRRLDANSALETGRFILSGGGEPDQSGWFTLIWVRTAAGWKAVHDHSS